MLVGRRWLWLLVLVGLAVGPQSTTADLRLGLDQAAVIRGGAREGHYYEAAVAVAVGAPDVSAAALRPRESYHLSRKTFHFLTIYSLASVYRCKFRSCHQTPARLDDDA